MDVFIGDSILASDTSILLLRNRNKIFNTNLFVSVELHFSNFDTDSLQLNILVKERWYIFPIPIAELADRNLNEWWNQRNHDLKRIEWGLKFRHDNFRGRNEKLKIILQAGFTKKYEIFHVIPYINKAKTLGLEYGISYSTNKNVGYNQVDNKLIFLNTDEILRKRFYTSIDFSYRKKFYTLHKFGVSFHHNRINDNILSLTPYYLGDNERVQSYIRLSYIFDHNKTNINYYPTKGYQFTLGVFQHGIGVLNDLFLTNISINTSKYFTLKPKLFSAHRITLKTSNPSHQPYMLQYGLGYGENLIRGYQAYVIDGQSFMLSRNELKIQAASFTLNLGKFMPVKQFETVPYAVYIKLISDFGYVVNKDLTIQNDLANRLGKSIGLGLDIVTYYDAVLRFEYMINDFKQTGFYVHLEKGI